MAGMDATLLEDGVGGVAGFDFSIHCDMAVGKRAEPDVVIAFPSPDETTTVGFEQLADFCLIGGHYAKTLSRRSARRRT